MILAKQTKVAGIFLVEPYYLHVTVILEVRCKVSSLAKEPPKKEIYLFRIMQF